jgi:hypothetical protein
VRGKPAAVARPLAAGETLGKVDRSSSQASASGIRALLSVTCRNGQLIVRTNLDGIAAADDCTQMISQAELDQFLGQPVLITFTGDHLIIESLTRTNKLELTAKDAMLSAVNTTP